MRTKTFFVVLGTLVIAILLATLAYQTFQEKKIATSVRIVVQNADGTSIAYAPVELNSGKLFISHITDSHGEIFFHRITSGHFTISVNKKLCEHQYTTGFNIQGQNTRILFVPCTQ